MENETLEGKIKFYDRLYKWSLLALVLVITVVAIVGVRQVFIISSKLDQRTHDIQQSMNCLVALFAQPNRATLTIQDVDKCTLTRR